MKSKEWKEREPVSSRCIIIIVSSCAGKASGSLLRRRNELVEYSTGMHWEFRGAIVKNSASMNNVRPGHLETPWSCRLNINPDDVRYSGNNREGFTSCYININCLIAVLSAPQRIPPQLRRRIWVPCSPVNVVERWLSQRLILRVIPSLPRRVHFSDVTISHVPLRGPCKNGLGWLFSWSKRGKLIYVFA